MIEIKDLNKDINVNMQFSFSLLSNINMSINEGKITAVLGPKGCGKSTLLKMLANLDIDESVKEYFTDAVYIPSKPSSFTWLTVRENLLYVDPQLSKEQINGLTTLVGLDGYEDYIPDNKSLGFRFRISLANAIASKAKILLIDESFSNVDAKTKEEILQLLIDINSKTKLTVIFATSNITEAVLLSDVIFLMKKDPGEIIDKFEVAHSNLSILERMKQEELQNTKNEIENKAKQQYSQQLFELTI